MAVVFTEDFEGQPDGTAVTAVNTSANEVTGALEFDTGAAIHTTSALVSSQTAVAEMRWNYTSTTSAYFRGYFRSSTPGNASPFGYTLILFRDAGVNQLRVYVKEDGTLILQADGDSTGWTDLGRTSGIYADGSTVFRLEIDLDATADTALMRLYTENNGDGNTVAESLGGSAPFTGVDQTRVGLGQAQPSAVTLTFDELVLDDASQPGTVAGVPNYIIIGQTALNTSSPAGGSWVVDTTQSVGSVTFTQTAGTTVSAVESPTGVWSFPDPGGVEPLRFDVAATTNGVTYTAEAVIRRMYRPSILTLRLGGDPSVAGDWR